MSLVYILDPNGPPLGMADFEGLLKPGQIADLGGVLLRFEVLDYARHCVRVLVDNPNGDDVGNVPWDGKDDEGDILPNGLYILRQIWRNEGRAQQVTESKVMLQSQDLQELLVRENALTDEDGRFQIPLELLPIGESFTTTDEGGQVSRNVVVSPIVHVYALRTVASKIESTHEDVLVSQRIASIRVDLTLP